MRSSAYVHYCKEADERTKRPPTSGLQTPRNSFWTMYLLSASVHMARGCQVLNGNHSKAAQMLGSAAPQLARAEEPMARKPFIDDLLRGIAFLAAVKAEFKEF